MSTPGYPPDREGWCLPGRALLPGGLAALVAVLWGYAVLHPEVLAVADLPAAAARVAGRNRVAAGVLAGAAAGHFLTLLAGLGPVLAAWLAGGPLMAWFGGKRGVLSRAESGLAKAGLGLGALAAGVLALGEVGLMYPRGLLVLAVILGIAGAAGRVGKRARAGGAPLFSGGGWWLAGAAGVCLLDLAGVFSPEWFYDPQIYHLGLPDRFLGSHRFPFLPEHMLTFLPLNAEMLYAVAMAGGGEQAAKAMNMCWGVLAAVSVGTVAARLALPRLAGRSAGWAAGAAAFVYLSMPLTQVESETCFSDNLRVLWETLAFAWVLRSAGGRPSALAVAGAFAGLAMGTKYLSVTRGALLTLGAAWLGGAGGRGRPPGRVLRALLFAAAAAAAVSPWLSRNWVEVRDPVYPLGRPVFNGLRYSGWELAKWMDDNRHYDVAGMDFARWASLPYRFALDVGEGVFGTYTSGPLPLALVPLLLLRKGWPPGIALALAVFGGEYLVWSLTSHVSRYFLPSLALLCAAMAWMAARIRKESPPYGRLMAAGLVVWGLMSATARFHHKANLDDLYQVIGYASGRLKAAAPGASMGREAVRGALPAGTVLLVGEDRVLGLGRPWRGTSYYNEPLVAQWARESLDLARFRVKVRQSGARSVLVNTGGLGEIMRRGNFSALGERDWRVLNAWWKVLRPSFTSPPWAIYPLKGLSVGSPRPSSGAPRPSAGAPRPSTGAQKG